MRLLLDAFERQRKPVDYFALDISRGDLEESFAKIDVDAYRFVRFHGLHGSYKDCAGWIASGAARGGGAAEGKAGARLCVFSLGSSVSNFTPAALKELLGDFAAALQGGDRVVLSVDTCENQGRIYDAFNDAAGVTTRFYLNGVENANRIVGGARPALLDMAAWELRTQMRDGCHVADLVARRALELRLGDDDDGGDDDDDDDDARVPVAEGERVELEQYRSFPRRVLDGMLEGTGLGVSKSLCGERGESWGEFCARRSGSGTSAELTLRGACSFLSASGCLNGLSGRWTRGCVGLWSSGREPGLVVSGCKGHCISTMETQSIERSDRDRYSSWYFRRGEPCSHSLRVVCSTHVVSRTVDEGLATVVEPDVWSVKLRLHDLSSSALCCRPLPRRA